jgi:hypothetical protein
MQQEQGCWQKWGSQQHHGERPATTGVSVIARTTAAAGTLGTLRRLKNSWESNNSRDDSNSRGAGNNMGASRSSDARNMGRHQLINVRGTSWTNYYERQNYVKIFAINP